MLNILSGRLGGSHLQGSVTINGLSYKEGNVKSSIGYVLQDDILFPVLTVKDTLRFTAALRLNHREVPRAARNERMRNVISALQLDKAMDTIIGGPMQRGVSGGERKRVNIANEVSHCAVADKRSRALTNLFTILLAADVSLAAPA